MKIRKCQDSDILEVYNLICELKNEKFDYSQFEIAFRSKMANNRNYYFLGIDNNEVVEFLSLVIDYQLSHAAKVATIEELIITSKFRNKGIGKELLNNAVLYAKDNNCDVIELTSGFQREHAHKFYEKNGFTKVSYKFKMNLVLNKS